MTLKRKIVLWYSIWMLTLSTIVAIAAFATGSFIQTKEIKQDLEEALEDAEKELFRDRLDSLDSYDDGVYIQIFDNSSLIFGKNIKELESQPFSFGASYKYTTDESVWHIIDSQFNQDLAIRVAYAESIRDKSYLLIVFPLLALSIIVSAMGGAFIVKKAFSPLDKMTKTAKSIATGNDLSERINMAESSEEEIRHLSSSFNQMLSRLENAFEKEKRFTDDVSHELRTPVAIIAAEAEYSLKHTNEKKTKQSLLNIENEAKKMGAIISQLISISRMEMKRIKIDPEEIFLDELIEIIVESEEEKARSKNISISYQNSNVSLYTDRLMLTRVLMNLIENAIQYGKENGWIRIETTESMNQIQISISDNGQGIDEKNIDKIFDRFFQEDTARDRSNSSSGLGLSIVKEIVSILSAEIAVKSKKGEGSTFKLIFKK